MLTEHLCKKLDESPPELTVPDCCDTEDPNDPQGCECCYDTWQEELQKVTITYSQQNEKARLLALELLSATQRRDTLKAWYDELTQTDYLSQHIIDLLEVMLYQAEKIAANTATTVEAIKVLYVMVRDFYLQVDKIKQKYDAVLNCIRCLNHPLLAPGLGIMKCLEEYGKKLDVVIATRDELIKLMLQSLWIAYRIHQNIALEYGLLAMIAELKGILDGSIQSDKDEEDACRLEPILQFPVSDDPYYSDTKTRYENEVSTVETLANELVGLNKKKESSLACKLSLEAALKEVDPKARCQ